MNFNRVGNTSAIVRAFSIALLVSLLLTTFPGRADAATTVIYLTSGTSWTVPSDWNSASNTIEVLGKGADGSSGGSGGDPAGGVGGAGGGGGAYSKISNLTLAPSGTAYTSFTTDVWFNNVNAAATSTTGGVLAKSASGSTGGSSASGVGSTKSSGSAGAGGSAGPPDTSNGGSGGSGGNAGGGIQWQVSPAYGSGSGGGGGAGGVYLDIGSPGSPGGGGGLYGGGGGGGGGGSGGFYAGGGGGSGKQGLIVITYTPQSAPTVTTSAASSITSSTATLNGSITATNGSDATQHGFAYSTNSTLSTGVSTTTLGSKTGTGSFSESISSLSNATTYYVRAYATNSVGTGYGSIQSFTTAAPSITITKSSTVTGDASVIGTLSKGAGTFVIDHPLDPKNKLLYHSFVESPDVKNIYDGIATLDKNGEAVIELPRYFLALNKDFRYLGTAIGQPMPDLYLAKGVRRWFFGLFGKPVIKISGGAPNGRVSWQVTGTRKDPLILAHPIIPEVEKGPDQIVDKGEYICPECYAK